MYNRDMVDILVPQKSAEMLVGLAATLVMLDLLDIDGMMELMLEIERRAA